MSVLRPLLKWWLVLSSAALLARGAGAAVHASPGVPSSVGRGLSLSTSD